MQPRDRLSEEELSNKNSQSHPSIFDRLYEESKNKKENIKSLEELKMLNELKDCTF